MPSLKFRARKAFALENDQLRVTVLEEGGHIAEVFSKVAQVNPLWIPHWASIEPSSYDPQRHPKFGTGSDAKLLAGIMGHNLCLDIFGSPSPEEALAGLTAHGESSVNRYEISEISDGLAMKIHLPLAQLNLTRTIHLQDGNVRLREYVENLTGADRPIAWTQHVTLSPPFLRPDTTEFRASMTRSIVSMSDPGQNAYLSKGAEFVWPNAPRIDGSSFDLRRMNNSAPASGYTAHVADPDAENAYFIAFEPNYRFAIGYIWRRVDFPWLGIWEENCSRLNSPWEGRTITRGMEFGVSPFPESRREMVERNRTLDTSGYRWLPSKGRLEAEYWIVTIHADRIPESLSWPGACSS